MIEKFKEALKKGDRKFLEDNFVEWLTSQKGWKDFVASHLDLEKFKGSGESAEEIVNDLSILDDDISLLINGKKLQLSIRTDVQNYYIWGINYYYQTKNFTLDDLGKFLKGDITLDDFKETAKEIGEELKIIEDKMDIMSKDLIPWLMSQSGWKSFMLSRTYCYKLSDLDCGLRKICSVKKFKCDKEPEIIIELGNGEHSRYFSISEINRFFETNKNYDDILNEITKRQDTIKKKKVLFDWYFIDWLRQHIIVDWQDFLYDHTTEDKKYINKNLIIEFSRIMDIDFNSNGEVCIWYSEETTSDGIDPDEWSTDYFSLDEL